MPASGGNEMSVVGIDHASFPTMQPEEMIAFYKRLGFEIVGEEEWRGGRSGDAMHVLNASSVYTRDPDGNLLEFLTYRP
jgi:catechol 2,3-dioxygenase-like lactoylglutathione lyase family enzyme